MRNAIRNMLDRELPPKAVSIIQNFALPLLFLLWLAAMVGGGA